MSATPRTFSNLLSLPDSTHATDAHLIVVPWSKFGASRLYVDTIDGRRVGWIDLNTGRRSLAMPELESAFELAVAAAEQASMPRRALVQAIESALIDGLTSQAPAGTLPEATAVSAEPAGFDSEEPPATMRHAYRGQQAFSGWDLGVRGKRLVAEELDRPAPMDARSAYQNPVSARRATGAADLYA